MSMSWRKRELFSSKCSYSSSCCQAMYMFMFMYSVFVNCEAFVLSYAMYMHFSPPFSQCLGSIVARLCMYLAKLSMINDT